MQPDDGELVRKSQHGDLVAFNVIVERYQSQVFNVAARILGNHASGRGRHPRDVYLRLQGHRQVPRWQLESMALSNSFER